MSAQNFSRKEQELFNCEAKFSFDVSQGDRFEINFKKENVDEEKTNKNENFKQSEKNSSSNDSNNSSRQQGKV